MPKTSIHKCNASGFIITATFIFSFGYAILRYNIMGNVPWKDLSFFILNKSIALNAFILLSFNFSLRPLVNLGLKVPEVLINSRREVGMASVLLIFVHVLMSFLIFNPANYGKFFETDGTITLYAGLSMLGGILSFVAILAYRLNFISQMKDNKSVMKIITSRGLLILTLLLGMLHVFFMGFKGWMDPSGWHGGLPPISLLAFVLFLFSSLINIIDRKRHTS